MQLELDKFHALDVLVIGGLPGAGKSHFAKQFFKASGRRRINRNEIRRYLFEMTNFGDPWKTAHFNEHHEVLVNHVERRIFEHFLQVKEKVLIDNTNVNILSRKIYIASCQQMHKSIGAIFINTPIQKCLERNHAKEDYINDSIIANLYAQIQLPTHEEGFKEILIIKEY